MFQKAKPVFAAGHEKEMNRVVGFYARIPAARHARLRIAGSALYMVKINGAFVHQGPARTCHGKYRVDEISIGKYLTGENDLITIRVQSSYCNSYYLLEQEGFLQAEVVDTDGTVMAYTGIGGDFHCVLLDERFRQVPRYSFQRAFVEAYRLNPNREAFDIDPEHSLAPAGILAEYQPKELIPRGLTNPTFPFEPIRALLGQGDVTRAASPQPRDGGIAPSESFHAFSRGDIIMNPVQEICEMQYTHVGKVQGSPASFGVRRNSYVLTDLGGERTGLISLRVVAREQTVLYLAFDEVLRDGRIDVKRYGCGNVVKYELDPGEYRLLTMEPYSFRYLMVVALGGGAQVWDLGVRRIGFSEIDLRLDSNDEEEQKIYAAAVETFRQNTYDIYMDCPSRERAGWLCDSFFTSRVEYALTGKSQVEHAFLENFLLPDHFPHLPDGMLPMCYPSDHTNGTYIPQWAMWYVLELYEYLGRSGDCALIEQAKDRMIALYRFLEKYENEDGLLEKLPSWNFIEWSHANSLVQDVNYPTNALYAAMLDALDQLYEMPQLHEKAAHIRAFIRENTLVNDFFCDNSVRDENGKLVLSGECTEACQYYMFFLKVASPQTDPTLWKRLQEEFGPERVAQGRYPQIYPANSFIGNYLRLEVLFREGCFEQVLREIKGYFLYMAEKTGTLWENIGDNASCNHGFASYVAVWLLGIRNRQQPTELA